MNKNISVFMRGLLICVLFITRKKHIVVIIKISLIYYFTKLERVLYITVFSLVSGSILKFKLYNVTD